MAPSRIRMRRASRAESSAVRSTVIGQVLGNFDGILVRYQKGEERAAGLCALRPIPWRLVGHSRQLEGIPNPFYLWFAIGLEDRHHIEAAGQVEALALQVERGARSRRCCLLRVTDSAGVP
jgi:hypothetical protein